MIYEELIISSQIERWDWRRGKELKGEAEKEKGRHEW